MDQQLAELRRSFQQALAAAGDSEGLATVHRDFLGGKGALKTLFSQMKSLSAEERPLFGARVNELRQELEAAFHERQDAFKAARRVAPVDLSLPGEALLPGGLHPLSQVMDRIIQIFSAMGFVVNDGPEVETEYYNFDALNTPFWHPARRESDSLYLEQGHMLRTETSPVQIRVMQRQKPPLRMIAPGRVYRNDKPDATHSPMFMQVEGLFVDEGVTFADLKGTLLEFYRRMFGRETSLRFRPHFFPFTEPSAEVDVSCVFCKGSGCRVCKQSGWLEMGGSGMVDPNVFDEVGIDSERYTGYAFGLGIERMAMLLYGVNDIRLFYENDLRFLRQF
ncbi:MAG: phenylalanine--tRNA ligase subunit alpha [Calditrichaeota bacterium]|nr:phenylalanine--tRNA ligase subunit alpha [Calditrichota bacterium]MCB9473190.1 phenylalanine--tRNA ligase subunit alpha [Candidatus Delongbacteria bacterium]